MAAHSDPHPGRSVRLFTKGCTRKVLGVHRYKIKIDIKIGMENKKMKIGAVVVTYNRLDKLKKALESFEKQLYLPAYVIVADNASTDGTAQYLRQWQKEDAGFKKIILTMESNMAEAAASMPV